MNGLPGEAEAGRALWRFALALYAADGVAETCLALQDETGADVNVLLFCCWTGRRGRRLDAAELAAAVAAIEPWRRELIEPLRRLRRRWKNPPAGVDAGAALALRQRLQGLELAAERAGLEALAGLDFGVAGEGDAGAVEANLKVYLRDHSTAGDEPAAVAAAQLAAATALVAPNLPEQKA